MDTRSALVTDDSASEPVLRRTLAAAGMAATGRFVSKGGWASRAWVGEEYVIRLSNGQARDAYGHEAAVVALLEGSDVPYARHLAHGVGPDGAWYISERLPGRTLHDAWTAAAAGERWSIVESLGDALRALHRVPAPADLRPPWLVDALAGGRWPAYHPPVVQETLHLVVAARRTPGHDAGLLDDVGAWILERLPLFGADALVLVHGDLHGSNVMVEQGRVTGLIDFAEAVAQPVDAELDTILRWCARPVEFPPTPDRRGLDEGSLAELPGWLRGVYPELFTSERLRARLDFYDMHVELAIYAHHPDVNVRSVARTRLAGLLLGRSHLDGLSWGSGPTDGLVR
ncbi:phosphotransferase family protein [Clavibacter michiganensis]|uniref:phosphotransferase family protein n=1 Tax=Clavibacter michiganensis TaxID=28447 RepID=UPI001C67E73C|nr:aminoglycoside phosphotransferase family protein [Clavibacter michiganensis]